MARFDSLQRAKILAAAIPVFAEKGLDGSAIRLVAQAAGVNSALLYYYFENKHTLFVEAIRQVMRGFFEYLAQHRRPFHNARDRLRFLVNGIFDYYGAQEARMSLIVVAFALHPELLGQVIQGFLKEGFLAPLEVLKEGMERGELKPMHPVQVWWTIVGACMFRLQMRKVLQHIDAGQAPFPLPSLKQGAQPLVEMLCDGLASPCPKKGVARKTSA